MKTLQVAYHTDFILDTQLPEGYLCEADLDQTVSRSAFAKGGYPIFWCKFCDDPVTQGLWFRKYDKILMLNFMLICRSRLQPMCYSRYLRSLLLQGPTLPLIIP